MTRPILYSFRRCPYAMRARLAIMASGTEVELREILLRDKAPAMLEASPKGTVPVLVLPDGRVIEESLDVMLWALDRNDPQTLLPGDQRDAMVALVGRVEAEFKPWLDRYKYPNRYDDYGPDTALEKAILFLREMEAVLQDQAFLFGAERSFADLAIAPFIRQFAHVDRDWFFEQDWHNLKRWLQAFLDWDGFAAIMTKYPKWVAGDPVTLFGGTGDAD